MAEVSGSLSVTCSVPLSYKFPLASPTPYPSRTSPPAAIEMLPLPVRMRLPGVKITLPELGGAPKLEASSGCATTASGLADDKSAPAVRVYEAEPVAAPGSPKVQVDTAPPLFVNPSLSDASKMRFPAARSVKFTGTPSAAFQLARSQAVVLLSRMRSPLLSTSMPGRIWTLENPRLAAIAGELPTNVAASVYSIPLRSAISQLPPVPHPASVLPRSVAE